MQFNLRRRSSAFTLVELLVVIGIITVLIALLLPSLRIARAQAQTTQCASNIRQVGQAVFNYCADSRGKLPAGNYDDCTGQVYGNEQQYDFPALPAMVYGNYLPSANYLKSVYYTSNTQINVYAPPVLQCPAGPDPLYITRSSLSNDMTTGRWQNVASAPVCFQAGGENFMAGTIIAGNPWGIYTSYVLNELICRRWNGITINGTIYRSPFATLILGNKYTPTVTAPEDAGQYNIGSVQHASETWMAWEAWSGDVPIGAAVFRHRNLSGNFLYFDGHVETLRTEDIQTSPTTSGFIAPGYLVDSRLLYNRQ